MNRSRVPYGLRGTTPPPDPREQRKVKLNVRALYDNLGYFPHPKQELVHSRRERFRVVDAGRRWGKSRMGPHDMVPQMLLNKPTLGWIVAPTYDLGEKEFRVFWEILVDKMKIPTERGRTFYSIRTKDFRIQTPWGSSVEVRSAEHPESLVGEGLDWVIMAESAKLKLSHWEKYIRPALSDKRGKAIFVSTPEGYNWFYDMYQRGQDEHFKNWWSLKSPSWDNTIVFPDGEFDEEMIEAKETLAREVFDQEYGAEFTSFAGRIYSEWDEEYHVYEKFFKQPYKFNPEWENYVAFDFGFRNPFACLNIQVDPVENVYVWEEYYDRNLTTVEHARRLKSIIQWRVDGGYHDPAGPDEAGVIVQTWQDRQQYNNPRLAEVQLNPAPNDWKPGIERVKEWLKLHDDGMGLGMKPRLFVSENCKNLLREINTYRVKETTEKASANRDPKEEPRKKDDHAVDALRYFIAGHFGLETHFGYAA